MSAITLELPETLLENIKAQASKAQVSPEEYIVFILSRQSTSVYEVTAATAEEIREQEFRFASLQQSLGKPNIEAARGVLARREQVEPESDLDSQALKILR